MLKSIGQHRQHSLCSHPPTSATPKKILVIKCVSKLDELPCPANHVIRPYGLCRQFFYTFPVSGINQIKETKIPFYGISQKAVKLAKTFG